MIKIQEYPSLAFGNNDHVIKIAGRGGVIDLKKMLADEDSFSYDKNSNANKESNHVNDELAMATSWKTAVGNYPGIVNDDLAI